MGEWVGDVNGYALRRMPEGSLSFGVYKGETLLATFRTLLDAEDWAKGRDHIPGEPYE